MSKMTTLPQGEQEKDKDEDENDEDDWFLPPLSNFSPEVAVVQGSCEALLLPLLLLAEPAAHDSIGGPTNLRDQDDNDDQDDDAIGEPTGNY